MSERQEGSAQNVKVEVRGPANALPTWLLVRGCGGESYRVGFCFSGDGIACARRPVARVEVPDHLEF